MRILYYCCRERFLLEHAEAMSVWGGVVLPSIQRLFRCFDTDCDYRLNRRMFMARAFKCEEGQTVNCPKDEVRLCFAAYENAVARSLESCP